MFMEKGNFLSPEQITGVLKYVVRDHLAKLGQVASVAKAGPSFDPAQARRADIQVAWAYRLLETQGANAYVRSEDRAAILAAGLNESDVAAVDHHLVPRHSDFDSLVRSFG